MASISGSARIIRLGIIGLGEIAQVNHISSINNLTDKFQITYLCDVSQEALKYCATRVNGGNPQTTTRAEELCKSPDVDAVLICNSHVFHTAHAILALQNDKYVLCEKPLALNYRDIDAIIEAEKKSKAWVFVGYQRRYAEAFLDAVKEVGGFSSILYARVRDIIGQNKYFVAQSGTYPKKFSDVSSQNMEDLDNRTDDALSQSLSDYGIDVTEMNKKMVLQLGGLGSHDLSAMREIIGMPKKVLGAYLTPQMLTVLFEYDGFPVTYESGINDVMVFDAHIEVYSQDKIVKVEWPTPYVKGLPVTMTVKERVTGAKNDGYQERMVRKTFEDPYVLEFLIFHDCVVNGKEPKTTAKDARNDLDLFKMIMETRK